MKKTYIFRPINSDEIEQAIELETICFPPHEACKREHMIDRIEAAADWFLVAIDPDTGKMAGFLSGIVTKEHSFRDEFFTDASTHDPEGTTVMLLGLNVSPSCRMQGLGRALVETYRRMARERGIKKMVLTCHDSLVKMYAGFGFRDLGISASNWGGEVWHEMEIVI